MVWHMPREEKAKASKRKKVQRKTRVILARKKAKYSYFYLSLHLCEE